MNHAFPVELASFEAPRAGPFQALTDITTSGVMSIGGIRDRRFQFCTLLTDQRPRVRIAAGNFRTCAIHAAAMEFVPELEAILSPPVNARSARRHTRPIEQHRTHRAV